MIPATRYRATRRGGFVRQRIVKSGTYTAVGGASFTQVTGTWVSDATYPCTVSGASMIVQGTKANATLAWSCPGTGTGIQWKKNGTVFSGGSSTARTGSTTVSVADGDVITCEILMAFFPNSTLTSGGYYELS